MVYDTSRSSARSAAAIRSPRAEPSREPPPPSGAAACLERRPLVRRAARTVIAWCAPRCRSSRSGRGPCPCLRACGEEGRRRAARRLRSSPRRCRATVAATGAVRARATVSSRRRRVRQRLLRVHDQVSGRAAAASARRRATGAFASSSVRTSTPAAAGCSAQAERALDEPLRSTACAADRSCAENRAGRGSRPPRVGLALDERTLSRWSARACRRCLVEQQLDSAEMPVSGC